MSSTGSAGDGRGTPTAACPTTAARAAARMTARMSARWWTVVGHLRGRLSDAGTTTAEYAMVTMAAVAFAGLLALVLRSDEVRGMLTDLVHRALNQ